MGYTHYFTQLRHLTPAEHRDFGAFAARAIDVAGAPLDNTEISEDAVAFNGAGDDSHEDFVVEPCRTGFQFCKTARKPYDVVVVA